MKRVLPSAIASAAAIAAVTVAGKLIGLNQTTIGLIFLLVIFALASWRGLVAGATASAVATICFNFFFLPPFYRFTIGDPANWIALVTFVAASIVANRLLVRVQRQAAAAEESRNELRVLYDLSIDLFAATTRVGALEEAASRALRAIGANSGGLLLFDGSPLKQRVLVWNGEEPDDIVEDMVAGVGRHRRSVEIPSPHGRDVYVPLIMGGRAIGAIAVRGATATITWLESVASLVALAVERERYVREIAHVEALRESDQLKSSLLRAVSHDLNSPLTAIALELEALTPIAGEDSAARVASLGNHVAQLQRRISNLLAMARIEAGRTQPRIEPTPAADLFRAARESLPAIRDQRRFDVRVHPDAPDLNVDPVLTLELLVNLIENADRASPAGQAVELIAEPSAQSMVRIEVRDRGPGITKRNHEFDDVEGRGLGLEIVRNLVCVQGGTFELSNRDGGGAVARVELPAAPMMALESI
ncbi:MAG TPA: DUF4118 domain-containing protein [Thermoanaerobaculia bacterium]|nr:DUF4118 domain-containing protein [Thermoanaerobaculia bacterium]